MGCPPGRGTKRATLASDLRPHGLTLVGAPESPEGSNVLPLPECLLGERAG